MAESKETRLAQLRDLKDDPSARGIYAVSLLQPKFGLEVVRAALRVLVARPEPSAHTALIRLFDHYATQGVTRDPGTYVRSEIMRALRPIIEPSDSALLEQALMTYEFPAPSFKEEAALLRSGALVTMAEVDDMRARFHATRLLADPLTDPMSGEPALTAITVLVAQGELLPLYFYVTQEQERMHAEVASMCLRNLGDLPDEVVPPLVVSYRECTNPVLLVGLIDLLLAHPELEVGHETLARLLVEVKDRDLYRYLAAALLAAGDGTLRDLVFDAARGIVTNVQREILIDMLSETGQTEGIKAILGALQARRPQKSGQ